MTEDENKLCEALSGLCTTYAALKESTPDNSAACASLKEIKATILSVRDRIPAHHLCRTEPHRSMIFTGDAEICSTQAKFDLAPPIYMSCTDMVEIIKDDADLFFFMCDYGVTPSKDDSSFRDLMTLMMDACLQDEGQQRWASTSNFLRRFTRALMPVVFWARAPGNITHPKVADFIAGTLKEMMASDPGIGSRAIAFSMQRCTPFTTLMLHMAGARANSPIDACNGKSVAILEAYSSEHGRLQIEGRYGSLERLLLEFDNETFNF